jgi:hypothetical protein
MNTPFKQRLRRTILWFVAGFIVLFLLRLLYGYITSKETLEPGEQGSNYFGNVGNLRKNYASEQQGFRKSDFILGGAAEPSSSAKSSSPPPTPPAKNLQAQAERASSQKYEKTASVRSVTSDFEKDEALLRSTAKKMNALIQYEQSLGNKGYRELHVVIGVNPMLFDSFYVAIQAIGRIKAKDISKVDKTNEYRQLNAKIVSLQKNLTSINELKSRAGQISDYIQLHDKILELERQMQELGVELGNFDAENEFCSVRFSLYEGEAAREIGFAQRVKTAFEWTAQYYAILIFVLCGIVATSFLMLLVIEKLKILQAITKRLDN